METLRGFEGVNALKRSVVESRVFHDKALSVQTLVTNFIGGCQNGLHEEYGNALAHRQAYGRFRLGLRLARNLNLVVDPITDERLLAARQVIEHGFAGIARLLEERHGARLKGNIRVVFQPGSKPRVAPVGARVEYRQSLDVHRLLKEWQQRALAAGNANREWKLVLIEVFDTSRIRLLEHGRSRREGTARRRSRRRRRSQHPA